jgi:threonine aldolase
MVERLREDHEQARRLAAGLLELPGVLLDPASVQTNILMFRLAGGAPACSRWLAAARSRSVLCSQLTADTVRLVTHRHIGEEEVERALAVFREVAPQVA